MGTYKALICDLDGVICSTDRYHYLAWKKISDELNIPFDEKLNDKIRGLDRIESLNNILSANNKHISEEKKEYYAEKKNSIYRMYLEGLSETDLYAGVMDTLNSVRSRGKKIAVASSSKNAMLIIKKLSLTDYFDAIVDGNDIVHSKPDPEIFIKISQRLVVIPKECLVAEDSEAGIIAAHFAGMDCASIGGMENKLAKYNLKSFKDLSKII